LAGGAERRLREFGSLGLKAAGALTVGKYPTSHEELNLLPSEVAKTMMPSEEFFLGWTEIVVRLSDGSDDSGEGFMNPTISMGFVCVADW
jgi:hypothetical protein